jgi:hypothetical protein
MNEETKTEKVVVLQLTEKEHDAFCLAAQWPEDKEKFKKLITPTNLTELII